MKNKIWFLVIMLLSHNLQARYFAIKNDSQFVDEINRYDFVVACFLKNPHVAKDFDRQLKKDINLLQETVKATSETDPYKKLLKKEVGFLVIDVSKDSMQPLISKYKIKFDEMPQFLLFKNGKALTTISGELAKLVGFISKSDLLEFIDDYFGKNLDIILEKKADEREKEQELQLARYQAYSSYRYPYGGWAPFNAWGPYTYYGYAHFYPYGYGYNGYSFFIP